MIKLITFDLDNTLWDVLPTIMAAEQSMRSWLTERVPDYSVRVTSEVMTALRTNALSKNPQLRYNISDLRVLLLNQALEQCGVDRSTANKMANEAFAVFMQGRNTVEFYPGALEAIADLAKSYRIVALTNGNADISVMPLASYFEFSMSPDLVQSRKPESKIFTETLKRAACTSEEVIHVGDNLAEDIDGAAKAGWHSVWVNIARDEPPAERNYTETVTELKALPAAIRKIAAN